MGQSRGGHAKCLDFIHYVLMAFLVVSGGNEVVEGAVECSEERVIIESGLCLEHQEYDDFAWDVMAFLFVCASVVGGRVWTVRFLEAVIEVYQFMRPMLHVEKRLVFEAIFW